MASSLTPCSGLVLGTALYWLLGSASVILAALPVPGLEEIRESLKVLASRGKTFTAARSAGRHGIRADLLLSLQRITVPHDWFWHFYALGNLVNVFLLAISAFYITDPALLTSASGTPVSGATVLLALFQIHLLRRLYESLRTVWPKKGGPKPPQSSARMHVMGYLVGLSYYVATPVTLLLHNRSDATNYEQRAQQGPAKFFGQCPLMPWVLKSKQSGAAEGQPKDPILDHHAALAAVGCALFLWGSFHQLKCHAILFKLRAAGNGYAIPHGDWFERVSCPHYLAENVIYIGLFVVSVSCHPSLVLDPLVALLLLWVVLNLSYAAVQAHAYYKTKFEGYPRRRKAIFPYIL